MKRQVVVRCLVGSHNYNLAEPDSDKDYKEFVLPTFHDLYTGNMYSASKLGEGTQPDVTVHDIRKLAHLWWKANINFIEVLYSQEVEFVYDTWQIYAIFNHRHEFVTMNLPYLYKACEGMYHNKLSLVHKGTHGTQHLVDKFGYDTKQSMHAYRSLDFIIRFADRGFEDFTGAMRYDDGDERDFMLAIKHGRLTLDEFLRMADEHYAVFRQYESRYMERRPKEQSRELLNEFVYDMVHAHIVKRGVAD